MTARLTILLLLSVPTALLSATKLPIPSIPEKPLEITRPTLTDLGAKNVGFSCKLASNLEIGNGGVAEIYGPNGHSYKANVTSGYVVDIATGKPPTDLTAAADPAKRLLSVTLATFESSHIGEWRCVLPGKDAASPYHEGGFFLLSPAEDHVHDIALPKHVVPVNYDIALIPFLDESAGWPIAGEVTMDFIVESHDSDENNNRIVMHANDIVINEDTVVVSNNLHSYTVAGHGYHVEREEYIIYLEEELSFTLENHKASMEFTAYLNDYLVGFYRSSYVNDRGDRVYLATTQFEATDARRAFPCLDEPAMKAMFRVKLGRLENMNSKSNMPQTGTSETDYEGYVYDEYEQSAIMSTYLLAFVVSDFVDTQSLEDAIFSVYHIDGKKEQTEKANLYGPQVLRYYEDYFDVPFPLPKMDMGAIPDFDAGAMENWGLILYREQLLLFQEGVSSMEDDDRILEVIAHELAHQWFGNLVTMEWWTDLWLNEGFATYVESIGSEYIMPDSQKRDRMLLDDMYDVFNIDALETSKPISTPVDNPYFDMTYSRLSYGKGNCLLRMIENFLTTETFNHAVTHYLENLAYSNAAHRDLWVALDEDAHLEHTLPENLHVGLIMEGYTRREGYPVVTATGSNKSNIQLEQKRFFLNPAASDDKRYLWYIPINVAYPGGSFNDTRPTVWMTNHQSVLEITVDETPYIINIQETGYYRVNYDAFNWEALTSALKQSSESIHKLNRAQLIDDSFNLARAGQLDYPVALELGQYASMENEYIPLQALFTSLGYLDGMFRDTQVDEVNGYPSLQTYVNGIVIPLYDAEDVFDIADGDNVVDVFRKQVVREWTCAYGDASCRQQASAMFNAWMETDDPDVNNPIKPDLKQSIYEITIANGREEEFNFLWERLANIVNTLDTLKIIYGLGASSDEDNLLQLLDETISTPSLIRAQDTRYVYRAVGTTKVGRVVQFNWLQDNYDAIKDYYGNLFSSYVVEMLNGYMDFANSQEEIENLEKFVTDHQADLGSAVASIEQGINTAEINMAWVEANYEDIYTWIDENVSSESTTDPQPTDPQPTDPQPTDPQPTDLQPTGPQPTDPQPTEPQPTEPQPTDPQPTEPQPTTASGAQVFPALVANIVVLFITNFLKL